MDVFSPLLPTTEKVARGPRTSRRSLPLETVSAPVHEHDHSRNGQGSIDHSTRGNQHNASSTTVQNPARQATDAFAATHRRASSPMEPVSQGLDDQLVVPMSHVEAVEVNIIVREGPSRDPDGTSSLAQVWDHASQFVRMTQALGVTNTSVRTVPGSDGAHPPYVSSSSRVFGALGFCKHRSLEPPRIRATTPPCCHRPHRQLR